MIIVPKKDTYVINTRGYLEFRADDIVGSIEAYSRLGAKWAAISSLGGFGEGHSLKFLRACTGIDSVLFGFYSEEVSAAVRSMPWLRRLSFGSHDAPIDLSEQRDLEYLQLAWCKSTRLPPSDGALQELCLWRYKPSNKDLSELPRYRSLRELSMFWGSVAAINGIEDLPSLTHLDLAHLRGITKIGLLARSSVTHVHLQAIKSIVDWPALERCKKLRSMRMSKMGILPSIGFLRKMPRMEEFRFVETKIADGDLSPLLAMKSVAFEDKRGYSHTEAEILGRVASRTKGKT